jgi:hydroxymethylpyrimidine pyrophosphatase-like HAD family hydrolase
VTRPRLIAVDLDGTLLDKKGRAHERDLRSLRAALGAGVHVSIITGRLYSGTRAVAAMLQLKSAVGCADGSHVVQALDHATLVHHGIVGAPLEQLHGALCRRGMATFVFADDAIGYDVGGAPFVEYVATWSTDLRPHRDVFAHDLWQAAEGVTAVIALGTKDDVNAVLESLGGPSPSDVRVVTFPLLRGAHLGKWALFVRAARGTKGTALAWIAEHLGVGLKDTVCVGDWLNDMPMFEVAGRSFCMGQAPDEVKGKATDVLGETVETGGGVARAVEEAFGIRA